MAVYRVGDRGLLERPPLVVSPEFDAWFAETVARTVVDVPLGGDGDVHEHWARPAEQLGLPLIAAV